MVSDFQEPINLISQYIKKWENGAKIVLGEKNISEENNFMFSLRKLFYTSLNKISETKLSINTTGTGLFDKEVINRLKKINDPYPYFRGLISEVGFDIETIKFSQPLRKFGVTKNNFFTLYDLAMLGVVKHSRMPLRLMTLLGFISSDLIICGYNLFYFKINFLELIYTWISTNNNRSFCNKLYSNNVIGSIRRVYRRNTFTSKKYAFSN